MRYTTLLLFVANVQQLLATYSGLYVDNGRDQTIIDRNMTHKERQIFATELLHVLGLPQKPKRSAGLPKMSGSAPKFLLEVYNSLEGDKVKDNLRLKSEDYQAVKESDSIITFLTKSKFYDILKFYF